MLFLLLLFGPDDIFDALLFPAIALVVGGIVVAIVTAYISKRNDAKKAADQAIEDERRQKEEARNQTNQLVTQLSTQMKEVHEGLFGSNNPWNPSKGLVNDFKEVSNDVTKIKGTLFGNGGKNNTVLDRLQRIEDGKKDEEQ